MKRTVETASKEFASVRTGRASTALLDGIQVDYYGTKTPVNQMATITIPEPRLIVIQPWDRTAIKEIEKAISRSEQGLNPQSDGNVIRLVIPELTEERRQQLARNVRKMAEEARVAIRNIRRDANDAIRKMEKSGDISEDDSHKYQDDIQSLTDKHIERIDELLEKKEKELLEI